MARRETVVLTNMCMVYDNQGNILVEDRLDPDWPGVTFPGGHVEPGESFTQSVIREVWEETGLMIEAPELCGVKQFPEDDGTRYIVFLYKANRFSGELRSSEEGKVFWIKRSELENYRLPVNFDQMIQVFEDERLGEHYVHVVDGQVVGELL
ncbi:MAG: 8-oxo-dGTP diphosphatase [Oscillospiraceae bacterium]|jgi:8-oxo-dGTP diphosphatase|nr:8-oxo-dGTP diphosphatase [Oscillospiraceae bacterium]